MVHIWTIAYHLRPEKLELLESPCAGWLVWPRTLCVYVLAPNHIPLGQMNYLAIVDRVEHTPYSSPGQAKLPRPLPLS